MTWPSTRSAAPARRADDRSRDVAGRPPRLDDEAGCPRAIRMTPACQCVGRSTRSVAGVEHQLVGQQVGDLVTQLVNVTTLSSMRSPVAPS